MEKKSRVEYIDSINPHSDIRKLIQYLHQLRIKTIHYTDTVDNWLEKRIREICKHADISVIKYPSRNFLNQFNDVEEFFSKKKTYFQSCIPGSGGKEPCCLKTTDDQKEKNGHLIQRTGKSSQRMNKFLPSVSPRKHLCKRAKEYVSKPFSPNCGNASSFLYPVKGTWRQT